MFYRKLVIDEAGVRVDFERLWRREVTKFETEYIETQKKKLQHLREKYKKKEKKSQMKLKEVS